MLFSVIIPTYHRNDLLAKCLGCLAPGVQTLPSDQYEVIVTDDGTEMTANLMIQQQYPWVRWVAGPHKGPAANRNNGAQYAGGDWLAFTDDDCLPDPHWLSELARATNREVCALEGAILPLGDLERDLATCPVNLTGGNFWSANIAIRRSLFEAIGGFDPNYLFAANEDIDLKIRILQKTGITFLPEAKIIHPVRFLKLLDTIVTIPRRYASWTYHVRKHTLFPEYHNTLQYILTQYENHLRILGKHIFERRFRSMLIALVALAVGMPVFILSYIVQELVDYCLSRSNAGLNTLNKVLSKVD